MAHRLHQFAHRNPAALFGALLLLVAASGCNQATPQTIEPPATARDLLDKMVARYRAAKSYQDSGQLRLSYRKQAGEPITQSVDDSVTFARPNKLRMHSYQAIVVCDGKQLRATVADLSGQVLDVPAPAELKREDLYNDEILTGVLTQGLAGESIQLALLLLDDPLEPILAGAEEPALLAAQKIDGVECYRVSVQRADGQVVLWIDEDYVLRRLDYPTEELKKQISQHEQSTVNEVTLTAEFKGARLNQRIADVAFEMALPEGAQLVKRFQVEPEPMHKLLGKKMAAFEFADLNGDPVTRDSLAGKVVVIDFWATWCGWCFKGLPNLQQVYEKYRDDERVAIIAVSTDEIDVSNNDLTTKFKEANLTIPILRDMTQQSRTMFDVQGLPSMFILGPDGTVQALEVGYQPQLAVELPRKLERLLAGENLFEQVAREHAARRQAFETSLANGNQEPAETAEIPRAKIAERSEPKSLSLARLWHSDEATRPGNILAITEDDGRPRVLVNDGWRTVVELDAGGQLANRYSLDIPDEAAISYLRTAVDRQGNRYYAGSASGQQQLILFDREFQKLLAYPDGQHAGISDVRLADLDRDGELELAVAYWGVVGVQDVALTGERRWADRALENVFCLAVTGLIDGGDGGLLACDGRGMLIAINDEGKDAAPVSVPGRFVRWLSVADANGDGQSECCAIASTKLGVESALGLSHRGEVLWTYDLPVGTQPNAALEMITSGRLVGDAGQWVVAGADGSIHILSTDGKLIDRFNLGAAINGLAVMDINGTGTLVIATDAGIDAWQLTAAE